MDFSKSISFISCLPLLFVISCSTEDPPSNVIETTELSNFETLVSLESETLALPIIIKALNDQSFIVYDIGTNQVLKLDERGSIVDSIGRVGHGPGEFLFVNSIFIRDEKLYLIESPQMLAHQYSQNGELISSFDFGKLVGRSVIAPRPYGGVVMSNEIDNRPFVTSQGDLLLSNLNVGVESRYLFQLIDWENTNQLSEIGEVPEGSSFILDIREFRNEALNGDVPSLYKANSFPVQNHANPDELFIVYSSISRIAKYKTTGEKLWENDIQSIEADTISTRFFELMGRMSPENRTDLKYYSSGVSNDQGELFLVVNIRPVVIHKFNNTGELVHKYVFESKEVAPVLDFDFMNNRIIAATNNGEIRIYPFDYDKN
ncbi:MAG TPA: hypothetical protein DCE78_01095 [Bacteroidetes bacterium]|nr:hypothetical protein [Bacteroidota bacterium]